MGRIQSVRRNWRGQLFVVSAIAVAGLALPGTAHAAPVTVDCVAAPSSALQNALATAVDGDQLNIKGTCIGPFTTPSIVLAQGITLRGVTNDASLDGNYAGTTLHVGGGKFTLEYLTITGGHGDPGLPGTVGGDATAGLPGGIYSNAELTLSHVTVSGNVGGTGGTGTGDIAGGPGGTGGPGAIFNEGTLTVINSTIAENTGGPGGPGGAAATTGGPGGVGGVGGLGGHEFHGIADVISSTISRNAGGAGGLGGTGNVQGAAGATGPGGVWRPWQLTLTASIVANNDPAGLSDCKGDVSSGGYNVIGSTTGCNFAATDIDLFGTAGAPMIAGLTALADHGGPTRTMGITTSSAAYEMISIDSGLCLADDQRGVTRPQGDYCEAGAVEVASTNLTIHAPDSVSVDTKARIRGLLRSVESSCRNAQTVKLIKGTRIVKTQQTKADGSYSFSLTIKRRTIVHVEFAGTPACLWSGTGNRKIRLA